MVGQGTGSYNMAVESQDTAVDSKEVGLVGVASNGEGEMQFLAVDGDDRVTRKLLRKLDFIVLLMLTIIYTFK